MVESTAQLKMYKQYKSVRPRRMGKVLLSGYDNDLYNAGETVIGTAGQIKRFEAIMFEVEGLESKNLPTFAPYTKY